MIYEKLKINAKMKSRRFMIAIEKSKKKHKPILQKCQNFMKLKNLKKGLLIMSVSKRFKQSSAIILSILTANLLTACTTRYVKPQLPSNLRHCEPISQLTGNTLGDLTIWILEHSEKYKDCSSKNEAKNVYFAAPQ